MKTRKTINLQALSRFVRRGVLGILDILVPKSESIVIRTFPDFDDQGMEMLSELTRSGATRITWLTRQSTTRQRIYIDTRGSLKALPARSFRGMYAYVRARVVIH